MSLKKRKPTVMHTIGHQTPAVIHHISSLGGLRGGGMAGPGKRARRSGARAKPAAASRKRASGRKPRGAARGNPLVAGSAAAKAWGAKMKRMRKKKGK